VKKTFLATRLRRSDRHILIKHSGGTPWIASSCSWTQHICLLSVFEFRPVSGRPDDEAPFPDVFRPKFRGSVGCNARPVLCRSRRFLL